MFRKKYLVPVLSLLVLSSACTLPFAKPHSQEALGERVRLLWEARVKRDWGPVYDMADSKFKKEVPRELFIKRGKLAVQMFSVVKVEVHENGKKGSSLVIFETYKMAQLVKISIKEIWIFEDGAWHLKLSDPRTPFDKRG